MYLIYLQGNLKYSLGEHEDSNTTKDMGKAKYDTEGTLWSKNPSHLTSWPTGSLN